MTVEHRPNGRLEYSADVDLADQTESINELVENRHLNLLDTEDDVHVVSTKELEVHGAKAARLVQTSFRDGGQKLTNLSLFAVTDDGEDVLLQVVAPTATGDLDLMRKITKTAYID